MATTKLSKSITQKEKELKEVNNRLNKLNDLSQAVTKLISYSVTGEIQGVTFSDDVTRELYEKSNEVKDLIKNTMSSRIEIYNSLDDLRNKLIETERKKLLSLRLDRNNSDLELLERSLISLKARASNSSSQKEFRDLHYQCRHRELEYAFSKMPHCSAFGINILTPEAATIHIELKRSSL